MVRCSRQAGAFLCEGSWHSALCRRNKTSAVCCSAVFCSVEAHWWQQAHLCKRNSVAGSQAPCCAPRRSLYNKPFAFLFVSYRNLFPSNLVAAAFQTVRCVWAWDVSYSGRQSSCSSVKKDEEVGVENPQINLLGTFQSTWCHQMHNLHGKCFDFEKDFSNKSIICRLCFVPPPKPIFKLLCFGYHIGQQWQLCSVLVCLPLCRS